MKPTKGSQREMPALGTKSFWSTGWLRDLCARFISNRHNSSRSISVPDCLPTPYPTGGHRQHPTPLTHELLAKALDELDKKLGHMPFAVCGPAAMAVWGFTGRLPSHISLVCPDRSQAVLGTWAATSGILPDPHKPHYLQLWLGATGGESTMVRIWIKYVKDEVFEGLCIVPRSQVMAQPTAETMPGSASTGILSLPSVLDMIAEAFTRPDRQASTVRPRTVARSLNDASRAVMVRDIIWILRRLGELHDATPEQTARTSSPWRRRTSRTLWILSSGQPSPKSFPMRQLCSLRRGLSTHRQTTQGIS